ncbi:hypothetical protein KF840_17440 [bacterium]|nr:hypothetical protein [bacterium]
MCADYRCAVGCECACTGDCDRNGIVGIEEIITAVNMALNGNAFPTGCLAALCGCRPGSFCRNLGVTVECLVRAVGHALSGCPGEAATPTVTPSPIVTPTIPAALSAAVAAVCGSGPGESREVSAADGAYTIACDRFEHSLGAVVRPFADAALATAALDDLRGRGAPVAFHDLDAVAWSARAQSDPALRQNHLWVAGCWLVWAYSVDVGLTLLNPVALSEAIYSAGVADGLFDTCASAPTPTPIVACDASLNGPTAGPAPGQQVVFRLADESTITLPDGSIEPLRGSLLTSSCFSPNTFFAARIEALRFTSASLVVESGCAAIGRAVASTLYGGDMPVELSSAVRIGGDLFTLSGRGSQVSDPAATRLTVQLTAGSYRFHLVAAGDVPANPGAESPLCAAWGFA